MMNKVLEQAVKKFEALPFVPAEGYSEPLMSLCVERAVCRLQDACNLSNLPEALLGTASDLALGEYLYLMPRDGDDELPSEVSSIKLGDTQVNLRAEQDPVDLLANTLRKIPQDVIARYRRLVW